MFALVFLRVFTNISLKREKGKKNFSVIHPQNFEDKRSKRSGGTFFFFHWQLMRSPSLVSRLANLFGYSWPWGQGNNFWGTWIAEMVGSGLRGTQLKDPLFLRTYFWGYIYTGNSLWSLTSLLRISSFTCLHSHTLLGCRVISGAPLAGQIHGVHESSHHELCSMDHAMETVPPHHNRVTLSLHCSP